MASSLFKTIRKEVGPALAAHGFTCDGTKRATFYRRLPTDVVHVIAPDRFQFKPAFDVWVFPTHPALCDSFDNDFPDGLPIVTSMAKLHAGQGVSSQGSTFGCKTEAQQLAAIRNGLLPALLKDAIPYLERFREVIDIIPFINETARYFWERSQKRS